MNVADKCLYFLNQLEWSLLQTPKSPDGTELHGSRGLERPGAGKRAGINVLFLVPLLSVSLWSRARMRFLRFFIHFCKFQTSQKIDPMSLGLSIEFLGEIHLIGPAWVSCPVPLLCPGSGVT